MHNKFVLYLTGFPNGINEMKIRDHFRKIDRSIGVADIKIQEQKVHSLATVRLMTIEDVNKAKKKINYSLMDGCELQLTQYHPAEMKSRTKETLFFSGLPADIRSKELRGIAFEFGEVVYCRANYNTIGMCKGTAQIQFKTKESAEKALEELNGRTIRGSKISVSPFAVRRIEHTCTENTLFIKDIPKHFTNEDLKKLLSDTTNVISINVVKKRKEDKDNRGFAYIAFNGDASMLEAERRLNGKIIEGNKLHVEKAVPKEEQKELMRERRYQMHKDCNLYVKNIPKDYDDAMLKKVFEPFGKVISARVMLETRQEKRTGRVMWKSKGFGFVCLSNPEEAKKALTAFNNGYKIKNFNLVVAMAEKKEERKAKCNTTTPVYTEPIYTPPTYTIPPHIFTTTLINPAPPIKVPVKLTPREEVDYVVKFKHPALTRKYLEDEKLRRAQNDSRGEGAPPYISPPYDPTVYAVVPPSVIPVNGVIDPWDLLSEQLYTLVEIFDPVHASKITGMLLELGEETIRNMIRNPEEGKEWVIKAQNALAIKSESN
jgi:RNA recognition motif-containing protein